MEETATLDAVDALTGHLAAVRAAKAGRMMHTATDP